MAPSARHTRGAVNVPAGLDLPARMDERELAQAIETLPQIVWITRPDGWHVHYNQQWMDFTGLTLEASLGFGWNPPFHPDDRGRAAARWAQATSTGEPYEIEYRLRRWDGTYRWMLGRALPLRSADGVIEKWVGTCTDIEDLKQAQAQLDASRTMQRLAGSMARVGGWSIECASGDLRWSEEVYAILEYPPSSAPDVGQALRLYLPESRARLEAAVEACSTAGTGFDLELELETPSGRPVWSRVIGEPRFDADGRVAQITGAFQDISAQRAASRRNEVLAERLTTTLESVTDAFYTLDLDWRFTYLNGRAEQLLQRPRSALLGRVFWNEFAPALGTELEHAYHRAMSERTTIVLESYYYPPLEAWFQVNAYPSEQGLAVYFRDVTSEHRDRTALRERVKEQRALATINGAAHACSDPRELCELVAEALTVAMQHPDHVAAEVHLGDASSRRGSDRTGGTTCAVPVMVDGVRQGDIVIRDLGGCPFLPEEEDLLRTVAETLGMWKGRHRASQALQQLNEELNDANAQLAAAAQLKDDLLSMASHELRTPLTPILGFTELMDHRGGNLTAAQREMVLTIRRNARRMLGLVDDLLVVSRAAADVLVSHPEAVSVRQVVQGVMDDLEHLADDVELDVPDDLHAHVDGQHLHQIVTNLLTNARKYGASPVVVSATTSDGRVTVEVRDHGAGVPAEFQPRMWDRFEQQDSGDRRTSSGTGLGLAIVRLLAELNGGTASYRDAAPGAMFLVDLPTGF